MNPKNLPAGSWVVIHRVISRVTILITHFRGLITPLFTTHEPPSKGSPSREAWGLLCRIADSRRVSLHLLWPNVNCAEQSLGAFKPKPETLDPKPST